jgi:hypothetical protein
MSQAGGPPPESEANRSPGGSEESAAGETIAGAAPPRRPRRSGSDGGDQPPGQWTNLEFSENEDGLPFAFRPGEVITTGGVEAVEITRRLFPDAREGGSLGPFTRLVNIDDPLLLVDELRLNGFVAQPNHVYFAHGVSGSPVYGSPVYGSPVYGSPVYGSPVYGSPVYGSPVYGSAVARRHIKPDRSTALPPPRHTDLDDIEDRLSTALVAGSPTVIVLDTGLAAIPYRPATLGNGISAATGADVDEPDENGDGYLDPAAGHGTFIAGVIGQIAPGCHVTLHKVLTTDGDGDEWTIANVIHQLAPGDPGRTILNLSFGGYVLDHPHLMRWTIRRIQHKHVHVVASAGNDATWRPTFPAALPNVVAVGALGAFGPAPFTNFGDWVDACAPGVDLVSAFFDWDGPAEVGPYGDDPDNFEGWATWSGTSFAGPVVVGNLVRLMMADGSSAREAIARLIEAPSLSVVPFLGTIVDAL